MSQWQLIFFQSTVNERSIVARNFHPTHARGPKEHGSKRASYLCVRPRDNKFFARPRESARKDLWV